MAEVCLAKLPSGDYHWTSMMLRQRGFRKWFAALKQQTDTIGNVYPVSCHRMVFGMATFP